MKLIFYLILLLASGINVESALNINYTQMALFIGEMPNLLNDYYERMTKEVEREKLHFDEEFGKVQAKLEEIKLDGKLKNIMAYLKKKAQQPNYTTEKSKTDMLYTNFIIFGAALSRLCLQEFDQKTNWPSMLQWFSQFRMNHPKLTKAVQHSHLYMQLTQYCIDARRYFVGTIEKAVEKTKKEKGKKKAKEDKEGTEKEIGDLMGIIQLEMDPNEKFEWESDFDKDNYERKYLLKFAVNHYDIAGPFRGLVKHPGIIIDETEIHFGYHGVLISETGGFKRKLFFLERFELKDPVEISFVKIQEILDDLAENKFAYKAHHDLSKNCVHFGRALVKRLFWDDDQEKENKATMSFKERLNSFIRNTEPNSECGDKRKPTENGDPNKTAECIPEEGLCTGKALVQKKPKLPKKLKQPLIVRGLNSNPLFKFGYGVVQRVIYPHETP